ncbi:hypothetical protein [Roseivirga sp. UBA1976]|uniref:hypothetical protein n=1 Tax=Roseivirga sp. UBA1976 TaxID=1947386 RepID=UPI00257C1C7B|nr:hypothetical protein [Roseivirga sp. UBA1976]MEC7752604.1 hypothetical protein [Bacteroidota bacterium]
MKNSSYFKIASTLLTLAVFAGCASLPVQQGEYDDVYFTSADRTQPKKVVLNPESQADLGEDVITLEKSSDDKVDASLIEKYNNGEPKEVVYFEELEPRVSKASELNYDDFVWDYNNNLLKNYDLPLDWEDMDAVTFNDIIRADFQFRNAWYEQYYLGNTRAMDSYASNQSITTRRNPTVNFNINYGFGAGLGWGAFNSPYYVSGLPWGHPFYGEFYDPYFWSVGYRPFWSRRFVSYWSYDPFWDFGFYNTVAWGGYPRWGWRNDYWYWRRNNVIIVDNDYYQRRNDYTRGGRLRSTSVSSVRADANNGTRTRSSLAAIDNPRGSRSSVSSGRVSSSSSNTTGVRSSRSSVDAALERSSRRVRTDAYRFDNNTRVSSSAYRTSASRSARTAVSNRTYDDRRISSSRSSANYRVPTYGRQSGSSANTRSRISFDRSSSRSRSSSGTFSRGSSSGRSSSGIGVRSSGSSSSRSSGGSVRSSGSSSGSRSSGSSSGSSRSSSGSSRSGRGN